MKKQLFCILFAFIVFAGYAQTYNMSNGATINTCSGTFYDAGGNGSDYNNNETFTRTFCSNMPGSQIIFDFTMFNSEQCCDHLYIYDGTSTAGTLLVQAEGTNPPALIGQSFTSSSGCLTFKWISDQSIINSGWIAAISCTFPCQPFTINITNPSTPFYNNSDTIHICKNSPLTLHATGTYPYNNQNYFQTDSVTTFTWNFGDGTASVSGSGMSVITHSWSTGFYDITVEGKDFNNCINSNIVHITVIVSITPYFTGTNISPDSVCTGGTIDLIGQITNIIWPQEQVGDSLFTTGTTYLPDGSGASYNTFIYSNLFSGTQVLTNANDITSVCINMEHSYSGDLTIQLICPTGQTVDLLLYPDGLGSNFLGEPIDNDGNTNAGIGYSYCWSPTAQYTINQYVDTFTPTYSFTDLAGTTYIDHIHIPAGNYLPQGPQTFNNLAGCLLNGNWTIHIVDNLNSDNGYIFWWSLHFNLSIIPPQFSFTNTYDSALFNWTGSNIVLQNNGSGTAEPDTSGIYTFEVTDDFACVYDTTINVIVNQVLLISSIITNASSATTSDGAIDLTVSGGTPPYSFVWSNAATSEDLINLLPESYSIFISDTNGCYIIDSITIDFFINATFEEQNPSLMIYPNITTDYIIIQNPTEIGFYEIANITGKIIKRGELNSNKTIVTISELSNGLYFLNINADDNLFTRKIIKQ